MKASDRQSMMGCSVEALDASQQEAEMENGLGDLVVVKIVF
jgi:hypothetical protein